jgi:hypothetical protein
MQPAVGVEVRDGFYPQAELACRRCPSQSRTMFVSLTLGHLLHYMQEQVAIPRRHLA